MKQIIILLSILMLSLPLSADDTFSTGNRLFYVERSKNKNIVCYDVNISNNQFDKSNPVDVYWINREEKIGEKNSLSLIQRKLAYGYKIISKSEYSASIALNACPDREIKIEKNNDKYQGVLLINNQKAVLEKIYVKTKTPNSIKVDYVELTGIGLDSGETIVEKIYN